MLIIFFHFLKIIFDISTSKRSKKYKPHSILIKKKIQNLIKYSYKRNVKQSFNVPRTFNERFLKQRGGNKTVVFALAA